MMYRLFIIFVFLLRLSIFVPQVQSACTVEVSGQACADPAVPSSCEPTYSYTCEGTTQNDTCPPNYHLTNNGCELNGTNDPPPSCFPAGTGITMSDGSRKNIEDVRVGEQVMSQDETGKRSSSTVQELMRPVSDNMCQVDFDKGESLKVTNSHPLYTDEGWKAISVEAASRERESVPVTKLEVGDMMVGEAGDNPVVKNITCWNETVQTYNLRVDNAHTYFAGGYLAHNKGGWEASCPGPVNCTEVDPNNYTDSNRGGFKFDDRCDLGNAASQWRTCDNVGLDDNDQIIYDCYWTYRVYSCCPAGTAVQCSIVNRNTTYQAGSPEDGYDIFIGTAQVVTNQVWGKVGDHCVYEEDGVCFEYENDYGWIYTYGTTNVYRDYDQVCSCVSNCTSVAPTAPTLNTPANAAQLSDTTVGLVWSAPTSWGTGCPSTTRSYTLYLGTTNPPTTAALSNVSESVTSITMNGLTRGTTYYWYVRASNGSATANSVVRSFTILNNQITGQVFYDPNNTCGGSGWTAGGATISLDGAAGTALTGTGTFTKIAAVGSSHTLAVNIPSGYTCSTGSTCNTCSRSGIGSPSSNNNFYLTDSRESWWQVQGAGIYTGGVGGVRSTLPSSSLRLILAPTVGTEGILMTADGSVDVGDGAISNTLWKARSQYKGKKMDFNYFAANMGVVQSGAGNWTLSNDITLAGYPVGTDFGYKNGPASVNTAMTVGSGQSYVIFVNGNLDVNANITVATGGFLAFIVNGTVTVDPSVTRLEGLYVIDDAFVTESRYVEGVTNDTQLVTGGSIVAWGTFSLSRSLGTGNITQPAEKFVYRSDLLTNMPDKMKTFVMQWNEVVPGTFNN